MKRRCGAFWVRLAVFGSGALAIGASAQTTRPVVEVTVAALVPRQRQVVVDIPGDSVIAPGSRLLIAAGFNALAWADFIEVTGSRATFQLPTGPRTAWLGTATVPAGPESEQPMAGADVGRYRAWVVSPGIVAELVGRWPASAELFGELDSLGVGARTAWIAGGANEGVRVGDTWWLRIGGQPAARFDARFIGPDVSFCEVVALATEPPLKPGIRVALWPSPGERRDGRAHSAVGYVSEGPDNLLIWVAAPRGVTCPAEPHVDFLRDGRYIGHGIVEQSDERFWYARFIPVSPGASQAGPAGTTTRAGLGGLGPADVPPDPRRAGDRHGAAGGPDPRPQSRTGRDVTGLPRTSRPQVGDDVVIRTKADIAGQRFVTHVFGLAREGALADAGEADGLATGQDLTAYRQGRELGRVIVRRVQRTYAVVERSDKESGFADSTPPAPPSGSAVTAGKEPWELRAADELRFPGSRAQTAAGDTTTATAPRWPPPAPIVVGTIDRVMDETLFTARLVARMSAPSTAGPSVPATAPGLPGDSSPPVAAPRATQPSPSGTPLMTPLAIQMDGRTIGVAVLVAAEGSAAAGFVVPGTLSAPLTLHMQLVQESEPGSPAPTSAFGLPSAPATTPATPATSRAAPPGRR